MKFIFPLKNLHFWKSLLIVYSISYQAQLSRLATSWTKSRYCSERPQITKPRLSVRIRWHHHLDCRWHGNGLKASLICREPKKIFSLNYLHQKLSIPLGDVYFRKLKFYTTQQPILSAWQRTPFGWCIVYVRIMTTTLRVKNSAFSSEPFAILRYIF